MMSLVDDLCYTVLMSDGDLCSICPRAQNLYEPRIHTSDPFDLSSEVSFGRWF